MALSCSKEEQFATLQFSMIEEHSITKSTTDEIRSAITEHIPTTLDLTLTRTKTGKTYKVATGESITLPVGEYQVKGSSSPQSILNTPTKTTFVSQTAGISVDEKVNVIEGKSSYTLNPTFDCFAIVADEDVASCVYQYSSDSKTIEGEGLKICFVSWHNDYQLYVTAKPADYDTKEDVRFIFGLAGVNATNGKFYVLHPEDVTTEEGGFIFNINTWTEGIL